MVASEDGTPNHSGAPGQPQTLRPEQLSYVQQHYTAIYDNLNRKPFRIGFWIALAALAIVLPFFFAPGDTFLFDLVETTAEHVRRARQAGVKFAVNSDAHSTVELGYPRYGAAVAQRGWLTADDVINAWPLDRLRAFLRKGR